MDIKASDVFMSRTGYGRVIIREVNRAVLRRSDFPAPGSVFFLQACMSFCFAVFREGKMGIALI